MARRQRRRFRYRAVTLVGALALALGNAAHGADSAAKVDLRRQVDEHAQRLEALKRAMAEEEAKLEQIRRALGIEELDRMRGGASADAGASSAPAPLGVAQAQPQTPVGQAPEPVKEARPAEVAYLFESPGVLTPKGSYVLEPSLQYDYASNNRIALVGYTIIPALLIGLIDVREVKRNSFTAALTGRWGVTNRFELEAKVPWVYRTDAVVQREILQGSAVNSLFESTGSGVGDVEFAGRYQFNDGGVDKPYYIGTLRFKTRTGKDPFEVTTARTIPGARTNELQRELPTGSGFYSLEPGLSALYPSDPAVFFGSVGYQYNFERDDVKLNTDQGEEDLGDIEPAGIFRFNFGIGLALNERSSFSIGYDHASVGKTKVNGQESDTSVRTQIAKLLLGYSYVLNDRTSLNVAVGAGLTEDTPDLQLTVRLPVTF